MTELGLSVGANWLSKLSKQLVKTRQKREQEYLRIHDTFTNPLHLVNTYIEPDCQQINPSDYSLDELAPSERVPVMKYINEFMKGNSTFRDGRNTLLVLSGAGMGKTSLLVMLQMLYMTQFWPKDLSFSLHKCGISTIDEISSIKNKAKTVLLLDSLDEDPGTWEDLDSRLLSLLTATTPFYRTIITCRTQFLPISKELVERDSASYHLTYGGFRPRTTFLSPFTDNQVELYLGKVYLNTRLRRILRYLPGASKHQYIRALALAKNMKSLRMRPLLLSHMPDLLANIPIDGTIPTSYQIYSILIRAWLLSEHRRHPSYKEQPYLYKELYMACTHMAIYLHTNEMTEFSKSELSSQLAEVPELHHLTNIDIEGHTLVNRTSNGGYRFSHRSIQEFLVASHVLESIETKKTHPKLHLSELMREFIIQSAIAAATEKDITSDFTQPHLREYFTAHNILSLESALDQPGSLLHLVFKPLIFIVVVGSGTAGMDRLIMYLNRSTLINQSQYFQPRLFTYGDYLAPKNDDNNLTPWVRIFESKYDRSSELKRFLSTVASTDASHASIYLWDLREAIGSRDYEGLTMPLNDLLNNKRRLNRWMAKQLEAVRLNVEQVAPSPSSNVLIFVNFAEFVNLEWQPLVEVIQKYTDQWFKKLPPENRRRLQSAPTVLVGSITSGHVTTLLMALRTLLRNPVEA